MSKEVIVESFELDHTIVKAPYVRLIGEETGPKGSEADGISAAGSVGFCYLEQWPCIFRGDAAGSGTALLSE